MSVQRWAVLFGGGDGPVQPILDTGAGKWCAGSVGEHRRVWCWADSVQQAPELDCGVFPKRDGALLAALAVEVDCVNRPGFDAQSPPNPGRITHPRTRGLRDQPTNPRRALKPPGLRNGDPPAWSSGPWSPLGSRPSCFPARTSPPESSPTLPALWSTWGRRPWACGTRGQRCRVTRSAAMPVCRGDQRAAPAERCITVAAAGVRQPTPLA